MKLILAMDSMDQDIDIWLVVWNMTFMTLRMLEISSSQLTISYCSEGLVYHQPDINRIVRGMIHKS